ETPRECGVQHTFLQRYLRGLQKPPSDKVVAQQERRRCSIFVHLFITTSRPARLAFWADSSCSRSSCIHTALAPISIASSTMSGIALIFRKILTKSTCSGIDFRSG